MRLFFFAIVALIVSMVVIALTQVGPPPPTRPAAIPPVDMNHKGPFRRTFDQAELNEEATEPRETAIMDIDQILALLEGGIKARIATEPSTLYATQKVAKKARDRPRFYDP
ncbi:hypothetical protein CC86DRAFT_404202 [Ophiobolus disseminans]|uniref:Uncharacterized protein n=1 Tax=Ophiobolus disseminans TaxID=1469910 RepID=A0A6A7A9Z5_9PLEO|nr:hypothetical protein CC86DRAFT_404202 [Ophiobolus disseminans]